MKPVTASSVGGGASVATTCLITGRHSDSPPNISNISGRHLAASAHTTPTPTYHHQSCKAKPIPSVLLSVRACISYHSETINYWS